MSALTSAKRAIAKTCPERMAIIRAADKPDEFMKHRVNRLAVQRWINRGMPDSGLVVNWPMNNRQRRVATRVTRQEDHNRRYAESRRWVTGKTARRRKSRGSL